MTATDELRRMLDERGVGWEASGTDTCWTSADGYPMRAWDTTNGTHMRVADLTPEQAIEATLGRGTCHIVKTRSDSDFVDGWRYSCSVCECFIPVDERDPETGDVISAANYCPNCGRRCVG